MGRKIISNFVAGMRRKEQRDKEKEQKEKEMEKLTEREKLEIELRNIKSSIRNVEFDLKEHFKDSVIVRNKLENLKIIKEELEQKIKKEDEPKMCELDEEDEGLKVIREHEECLDFADEEEKESEEDFD